MYNITYQLWALVYVCNHIEIQKKTSTNPRSSPRPHHSHSVYNLENGPALAEAVGRRRSNGRVPGRGGIAVARVVGWRGWLGRFVVVVLPFCLLFFPIDLVYVLFFCGGWMSVCLSVCPRKRCQSRIIGKRVGCLVCWLGGLREDEVLIGSTERGFLLLELIRVECREVSG